MKKTKFMCGALLLFAVCAFASHKTSSTAPKTSDIELSTVEAIASCEVSPDASANIGYCVREVDTKKAVCIERGNPESPRCSGNIE